MLIEEEDELDIEEWRKCLENGEKAEGEEIMEISINALIEAENLEPSEYLGK